MNAGETVKEATINAGETVKEATINVATITQVFEMGNWVGS